jgi:hypothetical protein
MTRPSGRLIFVFIINLIIGFAISWGIMRTILATDLRVYGFANLTIVAALVAFILTTLLDAPLKLGTFAWKEPVWPDDLKLPSLLANEAASKKLKPKAIIVFLINLVIGYAASWGIMSDLLETEFRVYGFANLSVVALLIAIMLMILLDRPLKLRILEYE